MLNEIYVEDVEVGQFVMGVGTVSQINRYHDELCVVGATNGGPQFNTRCPIQREANIVNQVELAYTEKTTRIVLVSGINKHHYEVGQKVKIVNVKAARKAA